MILWGYSLGGSVAANLAHDYPDVKGVIMQVFGVFLLGFFVHSFVPVFQTVILDAAPHPVCKAPIDSAADVVSSFLPLTGWSLAQILTQKYETKTRIRSLQTCLLQVSLYVLNLIH